MSVHINRTFFGTFLWRLIATESQISTSTFTLLSFYKKGLNHSSDDREKGQNFPVKWVYIDVLVFKDGDTELVYNFFWQMGRGEWGVS